MNVFVAGASGAIGRPLVAELIRRGHAVTGMTRSDAGATALASLGAAVARVSAFDAPGLERAVRASKAEVVIDELTALPRSPADMAAAAEGDRRLRLEGGGNLLAAARRLGARR
jgi:nucleoside-diphosphate-sugar epimerase